MIRIIGDAHGKIKQYARLAGGADYSISLGELGFDYRPLIERYLNGFDGSRHIVVPGNHDNYDAAAGINTFLTNPGYGTLNGFSPFQNMSAFYVRGACSVDYDTRTPGISWWPQEELGTMVLNNAIEYYNDVRPDLMITHTCPDSLVPGLLRPDQKKFSLRTEQALQSMLEIHQPKLWVFGHFHITKKYKVGQTTFAALGELATCDLDPDTLSCTVEGGHGYSWD